jgi:hypothetical protein
LNDRFKHLQIPCLPILHRQRPLEPLMQATIQKSQLPLLQLTQLHLYEGHFRIHSARLLFLQFSQVQPHNVSVLTVSAVTLGTFCVRL